MGAFIEVVQGDDGVALPVETQAEHIFGANVDHRALAETDLRTSLRIRIIRAIQLRNELGSRRCASTFTCS